MKRYWRFLHLIPAAGAIALLSATAHAQPAKYEGLVCDSQQAIESVFAYGDANDGASISDAIEAVNKSDEKANCGLRKVFAEKGDKPVGHVKHGDTEGDIFHLAISAECSAGICVFGEGIEGFAVFENAPEHIGLPI